MKAKTTLVLLNLLILSINAISQQSISGQFNSNGIEREFTGAVPSSATSPLRLVILFHGTGENAYSMEARGFQSFLGNNTMVVYPLAFDRMEGFTGTDTIDDYQMVEDLIAYLDATYTINTSDICIGGFSSGAAFTYNLVCEYNSPASTRDYQFKAFAIVSGFADTSYTANCPVVSQVPLIALHGTLDQIALYNGGTLTWVDSMQAMPTESIVDFWATSINGCDPNPAVTALPDTATEQFGNSYPERLVYDCPCTSNTTLYRIVEGLHAWPSGQDQNDFFQNTNMDINASALIAEFFDFESCDSASAPNGLPNAENLENTVSLTVFPNPTSHLLYLEGVKNIHSAIIYNIKGEVVKSHLGQINQLDINDLRPGFYYLTIESDQGLFTEKIIKQ